MVSQLDKTNVTEIIYPDSDSQPMADNTLQFRWITTIKTNLDWLFRQQSDVFVAGDLLWYPVENDNKLRQAPDIMVVFGRPKGERGSYRQWLENNISPQVVFEILSPGNTLTEMAKKQLFYDRYGVEEYYLYDPHKNDASGWIRGENQLECFPSRRNCNKGSLRSHRSGVHYSLPISWWVTSSLRCGCSTSIINFFDFHPDALFRVNSKPDESGWLSNCNWHACRRIRGGCRKH